MNGEPKKIAFEDLDEPDFVARLVAGGQREFDIMYEAAARRLKRHVLRLFRESFNAKDAEDIVEEALFNAQQSITTFKPGKGKLTAWLLRIAVNTAKNHKKRPSHKKQDPLVRSETVALDDLPDQDYPTADHQIPTAPTSTNKVGRFSDKKTELIKGILAHLSKEERLARVRRALGNIGEISRDILLLTIEGSDKEIAEKLDITEANVRVLRFRALKEFIDELQQAETR